VGHIGDHQRRLNSTHLRLASTPPSSVALSQAGTGRNCSFQCALETGPPKSLVNRITKQGSFDWGSFSRLWFLNENSYVDGQNLFIFDYDWRHVIGKDAEWDNVAGYPDRDIWIRTVVNFGTIELDPVNDAKSHPDYDVAEVFVGSGDTHLALSETPSLAGDQVLVISWRFDPNARGASASCSEQQQRELLCA
jgi:hypothetical protein